VTPLPCSEATPPFSKCDQNRWVLALLSTRTRILFKILRMQARTHPRGVGGTPPLGQKLGVNFFQSPQNRSTFYPAFGRNQRGGQTPPPPGGGEGVVTNLKKKSDLKPAHTGQGDFWGGEPRKCSSEAAQRKLKWSTRWMTVIT